MGKHHTISRWLPFQNEYLWGWCLRVTQNVFPWGSLLVWFGSEGCPKETDPLLKSKSYVPAIQHGAREGRSTKNRLEMRFLDCRGRPSSSAAFAGNTFARKPLQGGGTPLLTPCHVSKPRGQVEIVSEKESFRQKKRVIDFVR